MTKYDTEGYQTAVYEYAADTGELADYTTFEYGVAGDMAYFISKESVYRADGTRKEIRYYAETGYQERTEFFREDDTRESIDYYGETGIVERVEFFREDGTLESIDYYGESGAISRHEEYDAAGNPI